MTTKNRAITLAEAVTEDTSWIWQDDMITFTDDEGAAMSDMWGDDWNVDRPAQTRAELVAWCEAAFEDCSDD
jgi:hypothetical protein